MIATWRADHWQTLAPAPALNLGFSEMQSYAIRKPSATSRFFVDDEPLADHPGHAAAWLWAPGLYAGEVTAELAEGEHVERFLLDVSPDPRKMGREYFAGMIRDLWDADPDLVIGAEPATSPMGDEGLAENPWAAFARLRRYGPEALRALAAVRARPRRTLRLRRELLLAHQVRRVDRQTATSLAFAPQNHYDVPVMEETVDSAPNRALLWLLRALQHRAKNLEASLAKAVQADQASDTRTALSARWPRRQAFLADMTCKLNLALRQSPFPQVKRAEVTPAGLTAIAADPSYARLWGQGWRALRHGLDSDPQTERLWIGPSWEIYENWCWLRLGQLLASELPAWNWRRRGRQWSGTFDGRIATLLLQSEFPASRSERPLWSISKSRKPDIVLRLEHDGPTKFLVLDAKYRVNRAYVLEAMEKAHIYQDSLRSGPCRPEASLLLVPSIADVEWLANAAFHAEHRVGVHALAPGLATLPGLVRSLLPFVTPP